MTDYKQLCAELIDALDSGIPSARIRSSPLANRARAALAETEPDRPTDLQPIPLDILADIFSNTERPDKVSVKLAKTTRDLSVEYRDLDDEWFKELSAALIEPEPEPPTDTELSHSAEAVLSPAAQAVLDATKQDGKIIYGMPLLRPLIAAALRAAADQVVPWRPEPTEDSVGPTIDYGYAWALFSKANDVRQELISIATELEAQ